MNKKAMIEALKIQMEDLEMDSMVANFQSAGLIIPPEKDEKFLVDNVMWMDLDISELLDLAGICPELVDQIQESFQDNVDQDKFFKKVYDLAFNLICDMVEYIGGHPEIYDAEFWENC